MCNTTVDIKHSAVESRTLILTLNVFVSVFRISCHRGGKQLCVLFNLLWLINDRKIRRFWGSIF